MTWHRLVCLAIVLLPACAARSPRTITTSPAFESSQGCYQCLEARLRQAPHHPHRVEWLVLLVVRARELGISDAGWMALLDEEARSPERTSALAPLLDVLRDWPAEASGWDPDRRLAQARRQRALGDREPDVERAIAGAGLAPVVGQYLRQAFRCRVKRVVPDADQFVAWSADPLLAYGATACSGQGGSEMRATLEVQADRWMEADVALARLDISERRMSAEAERRLSRAAEAFPESAAIWLALAQVRQARAELEAALEAYASVLRLTPEHRDALLGQTVCLSQTSRHDDAIVAASRLIDLGMYHIGDAHYWRAWNLLRTGRVDDAWADSERALALLYGTDAFTLSGIVALARGEPAVASEHLQKAVSLDGANCLARTQLGVSLRRSTGAADAAPAFDAAAACHASDALARRRELDDLRVHGDASRAHVRSLEHAINEAVRAEAETALQAAEAWADARDPTRALRALAPALVHPTTRAGAEALAARLR